MLQHSHPSRLHTEYKYIKNTWNKQTNWKVRPGISKAILKVGKQHHVIHSNTGHCSAMNTNSFQHGHHNRTYFCIFFVVIRFWCLIFFKAFSDYHKGNKNSLRLTMWKEGNICVIHKNRSLVVECAIMLQCSAVLSFTSTQHQFKAE